MIPAFGLRSSVVRPVRCVRSGDSVPFPFRHPGQVLLLGNDDRAKMAPGAKPAPLLTLPPRPGPSRLRPAGMIRFLRLIAAVSFRDPCFHARDSGLGAWLQGRVHDPRGRCGTFCGQYRNHLGVKPAPLLTHCLLTRPIPASACGQIRFLRLMAACRVRSCRVRQNSGSSTCVPASVSGSRCRRR